jgi:DNA-binding CsgD family transcriptional regulator
MATKTLSGSEIKVLNKTLKMITALYNDKIVVSPKLNPKALVQKEKVLSANEIKITKLICQEFTTKEIASKLNLSYRTIENLRANIIEKTGSKNVVGLVKYAIRSKIYNFK